MAKKNTKKDPKLVIFVVLIIALVGISGYLVWMNFQQKTEMKEMVELMEFEKEQLEDEYEELAIQFDGYQTPNLQNDSLVELLSQEKQRVQDLLEELRITKVTNARRIAELKKELATVRQVMVSYVHQIDSLDRTNKRLVKENQEVKQQYREVARQAQQLEEERTQLAEVVSRASMLEISRFEMIALNKRDRKTTIYNHIQKLQFEYTIGRNITNKPGKKTLYMRITRPDGEVMQKSINDVFSFENSEIAYSIAKDFEYAGDEISGSLYWLVEEILQTGWYNADFFVDGELIGSFPFEIKK
jgi:predicted  nucleic acid-binding Zn-ribbon protein